jgi:hypothetical protein
MVKEMKLENRGVQYLLATKPSEPFVMVGLRFIRWEKKILGFINTPWGLGIEPCVDEVSMTTIPRYLARLVQTKEGLTPLRFRIKFRQGYGFSLPDHVRRR